MSDELLVLSITVEASSSFHAPIFLNDNLIRSVATPVASGDATNKYYVDTLVATIATSGFNQDVDGGFANSVYLPSQNINGGSA